MEFLESINKEEKIIYDKIKDNLYLVLYRLGKGSFSQIWCSVMINNFVDTMKLKKDFSYKFVALKINFYSKNGKNAYELKKEVGKINSMNLPDNESFDKKYKSKDLVNVPLSYFDYKFKNKNYYIIVYEMGICDIKTYFNRMTEININLFMYAMLKMSKSIQLIHKKGYVINDITPENFIVFGEDEEQTEIKNYFMKNISDKINNMCKINECFSSTNTSNNKKNKRNNPLKGVNLNYNKITENLLNYIEPINKLLCHNHVISHVFSSEYNSKNINNNDNESESESDSDSNSNNDDDNNSDNDSDNEISSYGTSIDDSDEEIDNDDDENTDISSVSTTYKYYKIDINKKPKNLIIDYINNIDNYLKHNLNDTIIYDKSKYYKNNKNIDNKIKIKKFVDNKEFKKFDVKLIDISKSKKIGTLLGSHQARYYRAPEIILGYDYDYKIDYWSLGCSLWELLIDDILFDVYDDKNIKKIDIDIINLQKIMKLLPDEKNKLIDMIKNSKRMRKIFDKKSNSLKFNNIFCDTDNTCLNINSNFLLNKETVCYNKLCTTNNFLIKLLKINPDDRDMCITHFS